MRYNREDNGAHCRACPLRDRRRVWGEVPEGEVHLAILGEAPGEQEDAQGKPFVGPAGKLLSAALAQAGVERFRTAISNVISCKPPGNKLESPEGEEAIECCRKGLISEMEFLKSRGLRVLVPLGNHALSACRLPTGISRQRGSVFITKKDISPALNGLLLCPSYHPAFLLRGMQKQIPTFVADLAKAKNLSLAPYAPPRERFVLSPSLEEVEAWINDALAKKAPVAVDIETTGLRPDRSEIFVIGLAKSGEDALSIPFLAKGYRRYWSNGDEERVTRKVDELLRTCPLIFQNALFDVAHLRYHGYHPTNLAHDVLLAHHAIHPELPHDLGYIVSVYGATPYWKDDVKQRQGRLGDLEDEVLRTYNLRDAVVLHQVLEPLLEDLRETGTEHIYHDISLPLIPVLCDATLRGIGLDEQALGKWKRGLKRKLTKLEEQIFAEFDLPEGFELGSGDHLRLLLYGHKANQFRKAEGELRLYDCPAEGSRARRKDTKKYLSLVSLSNVAAKTKPLWRAAHTRKTETGKLSTDEDTLLSLQIAANNRRTLVENFVNASRYAQEKLLLDRTLLFIRLFRDYQETGKLLSTYTDFPVWSDGKVHTSFKVHGTKTGRLASDSPNLQNLPKEVRHVFVPERGNIFLEADYSNLELRILAYLSDDKPMIQTFLKGENIHDQNTKDLFGIGEKNPQWDKARRAAKTYIFGRNYGGGLRGIYERVAKQVPELGLTYARFCEVDAAYRKKHPAYSSWAEAVKAKSLSTRRTYNSFGRVRILLGTEEEIQKEGLNTPIQGTAADIINQAMILIHADFAAFSPKPVILLQVHDSLLVECRPGQREKVIAILRARMEQEYRIGNYQVSFPVEITSGRTWGTLEPIKLGGERGRKREGLRKAS